MAALPDAETFKRQAAALALEHVRSGMTLGLGSGSTVAHFLRGLGELVRSGEIVDVVGVPTSVTTGRLAGEAGIPLVGLGDHPHLDLTVDGADEVTPDLDLIKGMGGALLREKMVAQASSRLLIIADATKDVTRLGTVSPLPVEVLDWGWKAHVPLLEAAGAKVTVRSFPDGPPFKSDNGHLILDCRFEGGIPDPSALEAELQARAGVVETGFFLGMATDAILVGPGGVIVRRRDA